MNTGGKFLTEREIDEFVSHLDKDSDGCISYSELEKELDAVYQELQPDPREHHLHHESRKDEQRHEFLRLMLRSEKSAIPVADFKQVVASWQIPSLQQEKDEEKEEHDYMRKISFSRKLRAYWEVNGPEYVFLSVVAAAMISLGVWQCIKYATGREYQAAFGWGVGLAKAAAGALYPTLWFLVLSMSRWYATFMRRFYYISRFINWDRSQSFHIKMSIAALVLATVHAIGHLSGTFNWGSRANRQPAVAALLGQDAVPRSYGDYVSSIPGWTGLSALACLYTISLLSMPYVRKRSYEIFQLGHLLMFPFIAFLMAHGSQALLQFPVLGIILAAPTLLVILERCVRVAAGFHRIPAKLDILDDETAMITCSIPKRRFWRYEAGQYVFLQIPQLSFFQWHPFTISTCIGREMQIHIKTDGDWTGKIRNIQNLKYVGIDGPYGAPAQRFYDFDQTIIVGAGIGVTPFSGILNDLQHREDHAWTRRIYSRSSQESHNSQETRVGKQSHRGNEKIVAPTDFKTDPGCRPTLQSYDSNATLPNDRPIDLSLYRRTDFHWIVRDRNYLLWFSALLNLLSTGEHNPNLDIRIHAHLTKKLKDPSLSLHIYRCLLEKHRTKAQPISPLTGLMAPTHFGRPDFPRIMHDHYSDMLKLFEKDNRRRRRVGVFFCGAPVIGAQLADLCHEMTLRGREDRSEIEYHFQIEVFG